MELPLSGGGGGPLMRGAPRRDDERRRRGGNRSPPPPPPLPFFSLYTFVDCRQLQSDTAPGVGVTMVRARATARARERGPLSASAGSPPPWGAPRRRSEKPRFATPGLASLVLKTKRKRGPPSAGYAPPAAARWGPPFPRAGPPRRTPRSQKRRRHGAGGRKRPRGRSFFIGGSFCRFFPIASCVFCAPRSLPICVTKRGGPEKEKRASEPLSPKRN
jgi:hypothetical protein